jgi:hypothetical protein
VAGRFLTASEIAGELGVSRRHASLLIREMSPIDVSKGKVARWRITRDDFDAWLEKRREEGERRMACGSGAVPGGRRLAGSAFRRDARIGRQPGPGERPESEKLLIRQTQPRRKRVSTT